VAIHYIVIVVEVGTRRKRLVMQLLGAAKNCSGLCVKRRTLL